MPYNPDTGRHDHRSDAWQNTNKLEMRAEEDADETAKPTRLGRPTLPTPLTHKIEEEGFTQLQFESTWRHITAYRFDESAERGKQLAVENGHSDSKSAELLLVNPGPHGNGYNVCTKCGFVNMKADTPNAHNRPYAIERTKVEHFVRQKKTKEVEAKQKQVDEEQEEEKKAELLLELTNYNQMQKMIFNLRSELCGGLMGVPEKPCKHVQERLPQKKTIRTFALE